MHHILGQEHAISVLQAALGGDRVHHAWIFGGPEGVGKFTTACAFAEILLDPNAAPNLAGAIEADPDGKTVELIRAGTHPDLHIVTKEMALYSRDASTRSRKLMSIPVEVIREFVVEPAFRSEVSTASSHARAHKVFILDEAELLAATAQNVLLKTLEEPPEGTILILVTSQEHRLLPTIRSRCQRVIFRTLPDDAMNQWIGSRDLDTPLSDDHLAWLLRFSRGAPGLAELAIDQEFFSWYAEILPDLRDLAAGAFPAQLGAKMKTLIDEFATSWVKAHTNASKDAANKAGVRYMLIMLAEEMRAELHRAAASGDNALAERSADVIEQIRECELEISRNVNMAIALDHLVVQMNEV